jgi:thioredoxin 1
MTTNAVDLTPSTYESFIKNDLVLIDVYAKWCGPCKQISPIIDQISLEFMDQLHVGKLNADENRDILVELGVRNIPTLILFKNGEIIERSTGMTSKEKLAELINNHLN